LALLAPSVLRYGRSTASATFGFSVGTRKTRNGIVEQARLIAAGRNRDWKESAARWSIGSMHPDSGCYEERYRLTGPVAGLITVGLLSMAADVLAGGALYVHVTLIAIGAYLALPIAVLVVSRRIAVRADEEGITFGPSPLHPTARRFYWVSVPWKDVKEIRLVKEPIRGGGTGGSSSEPFLAAGAMQAPSNLSGWSTSDWTLSALPLSPLPTPRALP
jgi:hypothetical protein